MARMQRLQIRFQRQPPGTAITRSILIGGGVASGAAAWLVVAREPRAAGVLAAVSGLLLLVGGNRANHGAGGPTDRMLDDLLDRLWDGTVLAAITWASYDEAPSVATAAVVALSLSFLSSYVRARAASLGYSVEESHVTRGVRYGLVSVGLVFGWLEWTLWLAAALSALAVAVRTTQVIREERA